MSKLKLQTLEDCSEESREILSKVNSTFGRIPNMFKGMSNSPIVAEVYLQIAQTLAKGKLTPELRELLAIAVASGNDCDYCIRAHALKATKLKVEIDKIKKALSFQYTDEKTTSALMFAKNIIETNGAAHGQVEVMKKAGWTDGEIAEIIAVISLNYFPNYFNKIVETENDWTDVLA